MVNNMTVAPVDAQSNATRLLCAGVYLDPEFADTVVSELVTNRHRTVAPSYGYDAVPVVAHALAVRSLRNQRTVTIVVGFAAFAAMENAHWFGPLAAWALFLWLVWATSFLRRLSMLETLATRLKRPRADGARVRTYPQSQDLTARLVEKISKEQAAAGNTVHYGGYYPFVGAGLRVNEWTAAVLLEGEPTNSLLDDDAQPEDHAEPGSATDGRKLKPVKPFSVEELIAYVERHLYTQLKVNPPKGKGLSQLSVEMHHYSKMSPGAAARPGSPDPRNTEDYSASRAYVCIRVGSWDQELVTSMFVGFDLRGDTLYSEFYVHVLPPVLSSFHAIDLMPGYLDREFAVKVALDVWKDGTASVLGLATKAGRSRLRQHVREGNMLQRATPTTFDDTRSGLARYASRSVETGARMSIREMAASSRYHHFFQEADAEKYTKIVERRLLQTIRTFLKEHDVDLHDYDARQTNILNRYGDITNNGGNLSVANKGVQSVGHESSAQGGDKKK